VVVVVVVVVVGRILDAPRSELCNYRYTYYNKKNLLTHVLKSLSWLICTTVVLKLSFKIHVPGIVKNRCKTRKASEKFKSKKGRLEVSRSGTCGTH
jgi:hypothetical protein